MSTDMMRKKTGNQPIQLKLQGMTKTEWCMEGNIEQ